MKRFIVSLTGALCAFLWGNCVLSAAEAPDALSSEGPALAYFNNQLVLAWAGESGVGVHKVWYSTFNGEWTPQAEIPGALTTSAPALGVADQNLYLATTPPNTDDKIYYYVSDTGTFDTIGAPPPVGEPLCDAESCARTRASPALLGNGATLYAAWSTPAGAVMYATRENGVWHIAPLPIPNAATSPTAGPTLALYQNRLYVAWVAPSGEAVSVASATLPLSSNSWSDQIQIPVQTKVAPTLGVFVVANPVPSTAAELVQALFISWTKADGTIGFARWNSQVGQWAPSDSPIPLPTGPLTDLPVALTGFNVVNPNLVCVHHSVIGYTGVGGDGKPRHKVVTRQVTGGCP
jgi:hypothetical protein